MRLSFVVRSVPDFGSITAGTSRIHFLETCLYRFSCVIAAACILCPGVVWSAEETGHSKLPHHHVAVFAGGGVEIESSHSDRAGFALGLIYEYRFHEHWGIGASVDALGQNTSRNSAMAFSVSYHPTDRWRLFAGPGVEFTDHGSEFLVRMGVGYEIPLTGHWTLAPELAADFIEGGTILLIGGVALGYQF